MTTKFDSKKHWENIYETKSLSDVSWYQPTPTTSLEFIGALKLPLDASIIDIGGGDSFLVDHLLALGYTNLTVLDISKAAIERAKLRLDDRQNKVNWIVSDVTEFHTIEQYDVWHDRASFHFLNSDQQVKTYIKNVHQALKPFGTLILGTFSENGPIKCSGVEITQYSQESMTQAFSNQFTKMECINVDHETPFETLQNFTFCRFKKKGFNE
ncbi:MAG: 2-polyprenyl-3-methyl-5-hydroxy-6-metoxy-1,4-benzoquinol methylase [Bacteroidia bacterium]|jgi:2-polyprenyl-3-methyl-5-hydroxy-6-metoxy-1,4-benzoquinol methylase